MMRIYSCTVYCIYCVYVYIYISIVLYIYLKDFEPPDNFIMGTLKSFAGSLNTRKTAIGWMSPLWFTKLHDFVSRCFWCGFQPRDVPKSSKNKGDKSESEFFPTVVLNQLRDFNTRFSSPARFLVAPPGYDNTSIASQGGKPQKDGKFAEFLWKSH